MAGGVPGRHRRQPLPPDRRRLLAALAATLGADELLLLGADLIKPRARLEAAYNDPAGVSARFTLNVLVMLNRELGANFDLTRFRHEAVWDELNEWMEIGVVSLCEQRVGFAELDMTVEFAEGEKLHTEISAKFRPEALIAELPARARIGPVLDRRGRRIFAVAVVARPVDR